VRITENEDYEKQYPARSLAYVTFKMKDGKTHAMEDDRNAHGRYLKPTDHDIEDKFRRVASPILGAAKAERVVDIVSRLETVTEVSELVVSLRPGA
jgi:2-methylcitrate dehydratase PrpD